MRTMCLHKSAPHPTGRHAFIVRAKPDTTAPPSIYRKANFLDPLSPCLARTRTVRAKPTQG